MEKMSAEDRLRSEINKCRNCGVCKTLLNFSCLVFPEIFRLVDEERKTGKKISTDQLRHLVNLCNFCGQCPCLDIREAIMNAKTEYMEKYGLGFKIRVIENVERIGKLGGAIPSLTNFMLRNKVIRWLIEKTIGIHRDRKIPNFPKANITAWLRKRNKNIGQVSKDKKKVAYFAGCTARYLFPEVAKAVIEVFEKNGIEVFYPEQKCCGMPSMLEGDRKLTMEFAKYNVASLSEAVKEGYDIVCSCPTGGFMLKKVLKVGAYYSSEYLESLKSDDGFVKIPLGGIIGSIYGDGALMSIPIKQFEGMLKDEGYFSSISAKKRIMVAENTYDLGEYLLMLYERGGFDPRLGPVPIRGVYYPPCHLRSQRIGKPYQHLLSLIPGLSLDLISGNYCCGAGGIMGFKQQFHRSSIKIGGRLIAKIKSLNPEIIVTDCLSCRIQFNQLTNYNVLHPIQIIRESYSNYQEQSKKKAV